jgi:uncharacterized membrane protein
MEENNNRKDINNMNRLTVNTSSRSRLILLLTIQVIVIILWIAANLFVLSKSLWDPFVFVLLNLVFSIELLIVGVALVLNQIRVENVFIEAINKYQDISNSSNKELKEINEQLTRHEKKLDVLLRVKEGYFEVRRPENNA